MIRHLVSDPDISNFPADPFEYEFSNHFQNEVIEDKQRHLNFKMVFETIKYGKVKTASGNADVEWVRDYSGVKVFILAGYNTKKDVPVVITGWPGIHNPRQAVDSNHWTEQQLREINEFNDGDGLENDFQYP